MVRVLLHVAAALLGAASSLLAQTVTSPSSGSPRAVSFSALGAPRAGTTYYCTNCTVATPCAAGGPGALAVRKSGVWVCDQGGAAGNPNVATKPSASTAADRVHVSVGAGNRDLKETPTTIDASGNMQTPGAITAGAGPLGIEGQCVAPGAVATPAAGRVAVFCDSSDTDRVSVKTPAGSVEKYVRQGEVTGGGATGNEAQAPAPFTVANRVVVASGAGRDVKEVAATIDPISGAYQTASPYLEIEGECRAAAAVAVPVSPRYAWFLDCADFRLTRKDSAGVLVKYAHVGDSAGGGGGTLSHCLMFQSCGNSAFNARTEADPLFSSSQVVLMRLNLGADTLPVKRMTMYGLLGRAGEGLAVAFYADVAGAPGAKIAQTEGVFVVPAGGLPAQYHTITPGDGSATITGTVWAGISYQGLAPGGIQILFPGGNALGTIEEFLSEVTVKPGLVRCGNPATGTGAAFSLPSICGTVTPVVPYNFQLPGVLVSGVI